MDPQQPENNNTTASSSTPETLTSIPQPEVISVNNAQVDQASSHSWCLYNKSMLLTAY